MTSRHPISCCEAVNISIGLFYQNRARIAAERSIEIEDKFRYCPGELATRSGLIFSFLKELTEAILAKFAALSDPALCRSACCESAALAIQQIGTAYANDLYTSVGSSAFTDAALVAVILPGLKLGYQNALAAIVLQSNCANPCDSPCDSGCRTRSSRK